MKHSSQNEELKKSSFKSVKKNTPSQTKTVHKVIKTPIPNLKYTKILSPVKPQKVEGVPNPRQVRPVHQHQVRPVRQHQVLTLKQLRNIPKPPNPPRNNPGTADANFTDKDIGRYKHEIFMKYPKYIVLLIEII